jgi:hypothetical protein
MIEEEAEPSVDDPEQPRYDKKFVEIFLQDDHEFQTLPEVEDLVEKYEEETGFRMVVIKSNYTSRTYRCSSHVGCSLRVRFGRRRGEEEIIVKKSLTNPYHKGCDAPIMAKGRSYKRRMRGKLAPMVVAVENVKHKKPSPQDVMKAAANLNGTPASYNQSFRVLREVNDRKWDQDEISYQLIIPYLQKFIELNPDSTVKFEKERNNISRIFLCPGFMKTTLRYVRPVISLDACHLKSKWKGVMYMATVKTASNEIYPVAIAIMNGNENEAGWTWFLELLHLSIELLVMDHPDAMVLWKYFTFISDRQKGLIGALKKVFPENHSCFCAIHIARNAEKHCGKRVADVVSKLSKTFSHLVSAYYLDKIGKATKKGRKYLEDIPAEQWRSTSWLDDRTLPPRYGITSTNMSESANNMFEAARDGSWLYTLDTCLGKIMQRISELREKVKNKDGVVSRVVDKIRGHWTSCAGYTVTELQDEGDKYTIVRQQSDILLSSSKFTIDIVDETCTCGEWQEHGYPCVDAIAYFRLYRKVTVDEILANHVKQFYMYANERELLKSNITPVCMNTLTPDGVTLPPRPSSKRGSGRPRKQRIRKRSRFANNPEQSNVVCSKCGNRGHNIKTCETRARLAKELEKKRKKRGNAGKNTGENLESLLDLS